MTRLQEKENKNYSCFRSEPMSLCQLYLQSESVYHVVFLLGAKGQCQFRDLNQTNNPFQRKFVPEIRRCAEMERKIVFFEQEMEHDNVPAIIRNDHKNMEIPSIKDLGQLEQQLEKMELDLANVNRNRLQMKHRFLSLIEFREILKNVDQFFNDAQTIDGSSSSMLRRISAIDPNLMRRFSMQVNQPTMINNQISLEPVVDLSIMTGSIVATRFMSFERLLWRITRGNILLKQIDVKDMIEDPDTGELQHKCLFILVCQGEKLRDLCEKICAAFHAKLYSCPESSERRIAHQKVLSDICDMQSVMAKTNEHRKHLLVAIADNIDKWRTIIVKVKNTYETMNLCRNDVAGQCFIAECWIPSSKLAETRIILQQGQTMSNSLIPSVLATILTNETPPTYNVTNKFTAGFQNLIDSYGFNSYGEVNPAPYSIISFPFIFAIMFGDTGHGTVMTIVALLLIWREKQFESVKNEIFAMFFAGRYIILLMGLFSLYTGTIYNDLFSKSINLFGSAFRVSNSLQLNLTKETSHSFYQLKAEDALDNFDNFRYYFGVDPIWQLSTNKVQYINTYKMKLSVVVGVLQMLFGVILSLFNHIHYREWICIIVEFVPQLIFLLCIFGYMNFMIFFKWFTFDAKQSGCAPSILITLINMFLFKFPEDKDPCHLRDEMFTNQFQIQTVLILLAVMSVPVMLLVKPIYLYFKHKNLQNSSIDRNSFEMQHSSSSSSRSEPNSDLESNQINTNDSLTNNTSKGSQSAMNGNEFDFGDVFIHQTIHTIEYCLGSISHTASYLRLWALSLAHGQLSEVLWNMVLSNGLRGSQINPIIDAVILLMVFMIWAVFTVVILIIMEGLSAFLHALRLHWVEFMSKFYHGTGYPFEPFDFRTKL